MTYDKLEIRFLAGDERPVSQEPLSVQDSFGRINHSKAHEAPFHPPPFDNPNHPFVYPTPDPKNHHKSPLPSLLPSYPCAPGPKDEMEGVLT